MRSASPGFTGQVVGIKRGTVEGNYNAEFFAGPAQDFANHVKTFPEEWILPNYQGVTKEALDYFRPLLAGEPKLLYKDGMPATLTPFNRRS